MFKCREAWCSNEVIWLLAIGSSVEELEVFNRLFLMLCRGQLVENHLFSLLGPAKLQLASWDRGKVTICGDDDVIHQQFCTVNPKGSHWLGI